MNRQHKNRLLGRMPKKFFRKTVPRSGGSALYTRPLVFAHYYLWYTHSGGFEHRGQWALCDECDKQPLGHPWWPALGEYDSSDPTVFAEHIRQFKAQGLDGITLNYWGYDSGFSLNARLQMIANALEEAGLLFIAFYEPASLVSADARNWLGYVYSNLVKNPTTGLFRSNYLWLRGHTDGVAKPVMLLQSRVMDLNANYVDNDATNKSYANTARFRIVRDELLGPSYLDLGGTGFYTISADIGGVANTQMALDSCHGSFIYNPIFLDSNINFPDWKFKLDVMRQVKAANPQFGVFTTVAPGYNDSGENVDSGWTTTTGNERSRNNGVLYAAYWDVQQVYCPNADIVLITSFNEHGEGSGIEEQTTTLPQYVEEVEDVCAASRLIDCPDNPLPTYPLTWTQGFGTQYTPLTAMHIADWKNFKAAQGAFPPLIIPGT